MRLSFECPPFRGPDDEFAYLVGCLVLQWNDFENLIIGQASFLCGIANCEKASRPEFRPQLDAWCVAAFAAAGQDAKLSADIKKMKDSIIVLREVRDNIIHGRLTLNGTHITCNILTNHKGHHRKAARRIWEKAPPELKAISTFAELIRWRRTAGFRIDVSYSIDELQRIAATELLALKDAFYWLSNGAKNRHFQDEREHRLG